MARFRLVASHLGIAGVATLASLLAAWVAIAALLTGNTKLAVVFSVVAFLLDILDGVLARRLGTVSPFGQHLDSMVDAINYSMFSALVTAIVLIPGVLGWAVGFCILACGILRLVLFTLDGFEEENDRLYYRGVITPHLTLTVGAIFLISHVVSLNSWLVAVFLFVVALAQLSSVRTLKSGVIAFWIPASILIAIAAVVWL